VFSFTTQPLQQRGEATGTYWKRKWVGFDLDFWRRDQFPSLLGIGHNFSHLQSSH